MKTPAVSHPLPSPRVFRVLVGAPRANSTYSSSVHSPGAVYKCRVHSNPERRCTEMDLGRGRSPQSSASPQQPIMRHTYSNRSLGAIHAPTHCLKSSEIRAYHTEKFPIRCYSTHTHTHMLDFPAVFLVHSLHKLPQASVLFYQNNAALCYS